MAKKKDPRPEISAPEHLQPQTAAWFLGVVQEFELEAHHIKILTLAAESWDRCATAREAIQTHGLTYLDRFQSPRARPEVAIERDSRIAFTRCVRELGLDLSGPAESPRPPRTGGRS